MLKTPLATLRRASTCPRLKDLAKRMGTSPQRLNTIEAGRCVVSDEFLAAMAKALGFRFEQVLSAFLEGRRAHLNEEARAIKDRLDTIRQEGRRQKAS